MVTGLLLETRLAWSEGEGLGILRDGLTESGRMHSSALGLAELVADKSALCTWIST